jgi:ribose-phosphate pyrophosphokinase
LEWYGYQDQIGIALMHKERKVANQVASVTLIGNVEGKIAVIVDDMVDTAGTLCEAAKQLKEKGAKEVYAVITHGLLNGPAADRINSSCLSKLICTDSVQLSEETRNKIGSKL